MRPIATTPATGETGWVFFFFSFFLPFQLAAAHVSDPLMSFLLGPRLRDGHHASSSVNIYASFQPADRFVTAMSHLRYCGGSSIPMDYGEGAIQTAWQQLQCSECTSILNPSKPFTSHSVFFCSHAQSLPPYKGTARHP